MLNLITTISYFIQVFTEVALNRLMRSKSTDKQNLDKKSIIIIWLTIIAAITIAVFISRTIHLPIFLNSSLQYVGVALIIIGVIFRLFAVYSLGQFFTVDVTIRQDHKLKKDGAYKYLRHPSYFASLISFIGLGWTFNN